VWNKQRFISVGFLSALLGIVLLVVAWIIGNLLTYIIGGVFLLAGLLLFFWKGVFNKPDRT
jgi:hypothetical protein